MSRRRNSLLLFLSWRKLILELLLAIFGPSLVLSVEKAETKDGERQMPDVIFWTSKSSLELFTYLNQ